MNYHRLTLLLSFLLSLVVAPAQAQSPCPHVIFRLDTAQTVDQAAVCRAAESWADDGIRIFIFLTDENPPSEAAWFDLLDQVEAEAGLRDLDQENGFARDALAFEASATSQTSWPYTITYGEQLFDTALDRDEAAVNQLKNEMRNNIQRGNASAAFVQAVEQAYTINNPPASPILIGVVVLIAVGVLGVVTVALYRPLIQPMAQQRRRRRQLQEQLAILQNNISNLLLACDQLLMGAQVEEAVLFQLFEAYGGRHYPEREAAVREWLRRSRAALDKAFALRRELQMEETTPGQALEQQVYNWEMIYLTLVGSSPRIRELTEEELRTLLDPTVILEREEPDVQLAGQLEKIRRQLRGMPLKVQLLVVNPEETDQEGILGYIDQVEAQIAELMAAQQEAPERLEETRRTRLDSEEGIASQRPFGLMGSQIFGGIDRSLIQAASDLQAGIFLKVIDAAETGLRDLEIVVDLAAAAVDHQARQVKIDAITSQGYRPLPLPVHQQAIEDAVTQIKQSLDEGDYLGTDNWIDELDTASERALDSAETWQAQHQMNQERVTLLRAEVERWQNYLETEVESAWAELRRYPPGNWADITSGLEEPARRLQRQRHEALPQAERLNSLETQQLPEAEQLLVQAEAVVAEVARQLQAIVHRLAEVQTAAANLRAGLRQAEADLARAIHFRDAEDPKIGPEVDAQIEQARQQLARARHDWEAREFIKAMTAQTAARHLATEAYASANEQVQRINQLQEELEQLRLAAARQIEQSLVDGQQLSSLAQTSATNELLQQVNTQLSAARRLEAAAMPLEDHALAETLAQAISAFVAVRQLADQAQKRVAADRQAYEQLQTEALNEIRQARGAINRAEQFVANPQAALASQQALARARAALPSEQATTGATREQLLNLKKEARRAYDYAMEARRKAEQAIREAQRRRSSWGSGWPTTTGLPHGNWSSPPGSGGWPRSSNRSQSRPSGGSSSGSSRPSSSGSSGRSSSMGSSRRSTSGGASRRSSSTGSSRRR